MLVIADAARPVAIAGVMGGAESEVDERTMDVLLESAWFLPASVRRTAKALEMRTEASYRFERGTDPAVPPAALRRAAQLILELAGGEAVSPLVDAHPRPWSPSVIALRRARLAALLGIPVAGLPVDGILRRLGFGVEAAPDGWLVRPPAHRVDVGLEVDVIEEVARMHGYDRIPSTLPLHPTNPVERRHARVKEAARRFLKECGLQEILTPNFAAAERAVSLLWAPAGEPVRIDNPLDEGAPFLRQGLLPAMAEALKFNENNYNSDVRLFELAAVYGRADAGHVEPVRLALGAYGHWQAPHWSAEGVPVGFAHLKGVVEGLCERLNVSGVEFAEADDAAFLQPGAAAWVRLGGAPVGYVGQLNDLLAQELKFRRKVFVAELLFEPLADGADPAFAFRSLPRFPFVDRDMSFVVDIGVSFSKIKTAIVELKLHELVEVKLVDLYRGADIPPDRRAMNVRLVFQHPERTLTDEEADRLRERAAAILRQRFEAQFR
jgi:phenylalanyl-tRNA synthetase beta chain